jgi:hypothetical protein
VLLALGLLVLLLHAWFKVCIKRTQRDRLALRKLASLAPRPWELNHCIDQVHESAHFMRRVLRKDPMTIYHPSVQALVREAKVRA